MITSITKIQVQLVRRVLVRISNATDAPLHTVSRRMILNLIEIRMESNPGRG